MLLRKRLIDDVVILAVCSIRLREKCPYSEFSWSVFSPNAGKYGPEKLRIRTLFMQYQKSKTNAEFKIPVAIVVVRKYGLEKLICYVCKNLLADVVLSVAF